MDLTSSSASRILAYYPDDITLAEATVRTIGGETFLSLFKSYNHTAVVIANAALDERFPDKLTIGTDDELAQLHLALLDIDILTKQIALDSLAKSRELLIATNDLKHIAGEKNIKTIGDVYTTTTTQNTADMDAVLLTKIELCQRLSHPVGISRNSEFGNVDIAVEQLTLVDSLPS